VPQHWTRQHGPLWGC